MIFAYEKKKKMLTLAISVSLKKLNANELIH